MKKRALRKLRGCAGESIVETLAAVLISALALAMLAGAITAARIVIDKSEATMVNRYYPGLTGLGTPATDSLTATLYEGSNVVCITKPGTETSKTVHYAVNEAFYNKPIIAYCM